MINTNLILYLKLFPLYPVLDRFHLIPHLVQVRPIQFIPLIAPFGYYKSTETYKLMTTFEKSVFQERVFHCLFYSWLLCSISLFVKPYTEIISQKVINQTNITILY